MSGSLIPLSHWKKNILIPTNIWLLSSLEIVMSLAKRKRHDTSIQTINLLAVEPKLVEQHKYLKAAGEVQVKTSLTKKKSK